MELMKISKVFALAAVFALVAGCGDANTQDDLAEDVVAEEVHSTDATGVSVESLEMDANNAMAEAEIAAAEAAAAEAAAAEAEANKLKVILPAIRTIYFDFDKSNIRSEFYDVLNGHAAYLMANPSAKVKLEGHTDARGSAEYNNALGEYRGNAVQRYLSLQGVSANQLEVVSYGKMKLANKANSSEAHSKNRRVVFNY
ncbi:MAG TPA: OmpA family protein [Marinospirillum sp.]|uniref:OmpA family protein n=1 Tax=Marinospirillum sp. TaxID=2183934 RepID=UPI002B49CC4C|nr:OmpA family protein [Marinospirillum sp.]HKM15337.1 OmpA family protein [Marinospirillum sp.]